MSNIVIRETVNSPVFDKSKVKRRYPMNDLMCVFTHYDKSKGINVPTENNKVSKP